MSDPRTHRRRTFTVAAAVALLVVTAAAWPSSASPGTAPGVEGAWAIRLDVTVAGVPEALIGVMTLDKSGGCALAVRSSFAGYAHDHTTEIRPVDAALEEDDPPCTWSQPGSTRPLVDGVVVAYGLGEAGSVELSFVLAENGRRLLLLLDGTHPGIIGTGEGFRR